VLRRLVQYLFGPVVRGMLQSFGFDQLPPQVLRRPRGASDLPSVAAQLLQLPCSDVLCPV
jgi:hypothetical protein